MDRSTSLRPARLCAAALMIATLGASTSLAEVPSAAAVDPFASSFDHLARPDISSEPERGAVDVTQIEAPDRPAARWLGGGMASYYGRRFAGRSTANGEIFDPTQMTAAHRTLPFGSVVRVINPKNGRSVVVRINDRGPYHNNRVIDLSRAAAEEIGIVEKGRAKVELELLEN